jgi:GTPase SAR1 family protein
VYDVTDHSSFKGMLLVTIPEMHVHSSSCSFAAIRKWVDDLNDGGIGDPKGVPRLLVGNKTDATNRAVSTEQGRKLAEDIGAVFCETSAKNSEGVTTAFMTLAR